MINSFNVGLKVGGDNRPLEIQPIGKSMTRKDYIKIVEAIKDYAVFEKSRTKDTHFNHYPLVNLFAGHLSDDNPRFDKYKFTTAVDNALLKVSLEASVERAIEDAQK